MPARKQILDWGDEVLAGFRALSPHRQAADGLRGELLELRGALREMARTVTALAKAARKPTGTTGVAAHPMMRVP